MMTNLEVVSDLLPKILFATACGAVVGFEREKKRAAAGLKTNILICVGSTLFTFCSLMIVKMEGTGDAGRTIAQIVSGIGFLGAGAIIRGNEDKVIGLTTAAFIWLMAALGIMVGLGYGPVAVGVAFGAAVAMRVISIFENKYIRNGHGHEKHHGHFHGTNHDVDIEDGATIKFVVNEREHRKKK